MRSREESSAESSGFRCPGCGGPTRVSETRKSDDRLRRRRICQSCERRITTMEMQVIGAWKGEPLIAIPRRIFQRIASIANAALLDPNLSPSTPRIRRSAPLVADQSVAPTPARAPMLMPVADPIPGSDLE